MGLWFSLGHASVVVIMCIVVSASSDFMRTHLDSTEDVGSIIGTAVSATVLFLIGGFNMWVACSLIKRWRTLRASSDNEDEHPAWITHAEDDGHTHIVQVTETAEVEGPGFLSKCCPRIFKAVDAPWKM